MGVLDRGDQGDGNEIDLKEGGGIEMSTTVLHSRAAPSLKYSPLTLFAKEIVLKLRCDISLQEQM